MAESDPLTILLLHDRWATGQVLEACEGLPEEAFHRRFEIGPGSLHDALTHIVGTMVLIFETFEPERLSVIFVPSFVVPLSFAASAAGTRAKEAATATAAGSAVTPTDRSGKRDGLPPPGANRPGCGRRGRRPVPAL